MDLVKKSSNVGRRLDELVDVELRIPIRPVRSPFPPRARVSKPGHPRPGPLRSNLLRIPWRPTFEDRYRPLIDVDFDTNLFTRVRRDLLVLTG